MTITDLLSLPLLGRRRHRWNVFHQGGTGVGVETNAVHLGRPKNGWLIRATRLQQIFGVYRCIWTVYIIELTFKNYISTTYTSILSIYIYIYRLKLFISWGPPLVWLPHESTLGRSSRSSPWTAGVPVGQLGHRLFVDCIVPIFLLVDVSWWFQNVWNMTESHWRSLSHVGTKNNKCLKLPVRGNQKAISSSSHTINTSRQKPVQ